MTVPDSLFTAPPAIVGMGTVGRAMAKLFGEHVPYDVQTHGIEQRERVNAAPIAFVCVPTPMLPDGRCDLRAVEETVAWCETPLVVLRSTVPPGTTDACIARTGKRIVFCPEYLGETAGHPYAEGAPFLVLGGARRETTLVADFFKRFHHASMRFHFSDARTAELCKYMENAFFATKVAFCNEMYDVATAMGVDFNELRELWLADERIERDHTFVFANDRGFGGRCLPKDMSALAHAARGAGRRAELIEAVLRANDRVRGSSYAEWLDRE